MQATFVLERSKGLAAVSVSSIIKHAFLNGRDRVAVPVSSIVSYNS